MTDIEKLAALKAMVGVSDTDEVLSTYLKLSGSKILAKAYPYDDTVTEVPAKYEYLQIEIAAYMLNKRGAEDRPLTPKTALHDSMRTRIFPRPCSRRSLHIAG